MTFKVFNISTQQQETNQKQINIFVSNWPPSHVFQFSICDSTTGKDLIEKFHQEILKDHHFQKELSLSFDYGKISERESLFSLGIETNVCSNSKIHFDLQSLSFRLTCWLIFQK